jgi:hypothetical protein
MLKCFAMIDDADRPSDKFYALYGRCINEWAHIDELLCEFFTFALGTDEHRAAVIYYSWVSIGQRKAQTDKLMNIILSNDELREHRKAWAHASAEIEKHLAFRNDLAHEPIRAWRRVLLTANKTKDQTAALKAEREAKGHKYGLWHEVYTSPKKILKGAKPKAIREDNLRKHLEDVKRIRTALQALAQDIEGTLRKLFPEQERRTDPNSAC